MATCPVCNGDKIERCNNPDHGFIDAMSFIDIGRIGCPCCGHDEKHRIRSWVNGKWEWNRCEFCDDAGNLKPEMTDEANIFIQ